MDKLEIFHANQTYMCLDPHQNKVEVGTVKLAQDLQYFRTDHSKMVFLFFGTFLCVCLCYIVLSVSYYIEVTC